MTSPRAIHADLVRALADRPAKVRPFEVSRTPQSGPCDTMKPHVSHALAEFYRCPEQLLAPCSIQELHPQPGYFRFGPDAVCYAQSSFASLNHNAAKLLSDASPHVIANRSALHLPFDPEQVIDNLRRERYANDGSQANRGILSTQTVRQAYYQCRPLLGVSVRKHLQRLFFRDWRCLTFPRWPVDNSVENILERLLLLSLQANQAKQIPFIWFWPEGASSCINVTHDVETEAGFGTISHMLDVDESFGIRASYQLVPEKRYSTPPALRTEILKRGCEINIQDLNHDGRLFRDRKTFLSRAAAINCYLQEYNAQGFRSGSLYRNAEWLEALDASYDMSIPNVAHLEPQRGGCCTVFPYFIGKILELPVTTIQDYTLFHILKDYSIDIWKQQIELITGRNGLLSFIVHPDYILDDQTRGVYQSLLSHLSWLCSEGGAWMALPGEVNRWWRERSRMELIFADGKWRIQGAGSERARIAYASVAEDRVVYTMASQ